MLIQRIDRKILPVAQALNSFIVLYTIFRLSVTEKNPSPCTVSSILTKPKILKQSESTLESLILTTSCFKPKHRNSFSNEVWAVFGCVSDVHPVNLAIEFHYNQWISLHIQKHIHHQRWMQFINFMFHSCLSLACSVSVRLSGGTCPRRQSTLEHIWACFGLALPQCRQLSTAWLCFPTA